MGGPHATASSWLLQWGSAEWIRALGACGFVRLHVLRTWANIELHNGQWVLRLCVNSAYWAISVGTFNATVCHPESLNIHAPFFEDTSFCWGQQCTCHSMSRLMTADSACT